MDGSDWEKLRKHLKRLQKDVDVDYIVPELVEAKVLDLDNQQELVAIPTNVKKIDKLLDMLRKLPAERKAFASFMRALKSSKDKQLIDLAEKIERTPTMSDTSVRSKVSPAFSESKVNEFLIQNFAHKANAETHIDDIRCVLLENKAFVDNEWTNKQIADYVCTKAFVGVEKVNKKIEPGKSKLFFKNLEKVDVMVASSSQVESLAVAAGPKDMTDIKNLSPSDLKKFLLDKFEEKKLRIGPHTLSELEEEEINGEILMLLNEQDMEYKMPSCKLGHRKVILDIIEQYKQQKKREVPEVEFEKFRKFDTDVSTDRYVQGKTVDATINSRGKKTAPIRNFHLPEVGSDSDMRNYVYEECAKFASACINERRNGTIYFGISRDETRGHRKGEIVGISFSLQNLDHYLSSMFFPNQMHMVKHCVRNVKIVPVVTDKNDCLLQVLEFDIVPGKCLQEDEYIKINTRAIPRLSKKLKVRDPVFTFSEFGIPKLLQPNETCANSKIPPSVIEQRVSDESKDFGPERSNLNHLRNHLTGGLDKIDDAIYIFFLLSPISKSSIDLNHLEFIQRLQPDVVFDFDPHEDTGGIYNALEEKQEIVRVVTLNDFDDRQKEKKVIKSFQNELVDCKLTNWVFCNGYGQMEEMKAIDWNKKRSHAFQNAFTHYLEKFQQDRVLVIICLFSSMYNAALDPCEIILRQLPEQWIVLSETQSLADLWQKTFKMREKVDVKDLNDRCMIGLSWERINNGINNWCEKKDNTECMIPESSGSFISVDNKKIKEWSDIQVLSVVDPTDANDDEKTKTAKKKQAEEDFYRGGQVQWLNFFSDHVCRRKIHQTLLKLVEDGLEKRSNEVEDKILTTYLFHEPGAGGSTSARDILWSLRDKYRCCVVNEMTNPSQTSEQLTEMFLFRDKSPKPLLVLLDNEDEDKVFQLRVSLEKIARKYDEVIPNVFCVLLICCRMVCVPIAKRKHSMVPLKQMLEEEDLIWFEQRYKDLTTRYDNPKSLISFNILKENFNKEYIKNTVKEFLAEIKDEKEEKILKTVSFINNFDLDFKFIHVSCFDTILEPRTTLKSNLEGTRKASWEANVSLSFKVLLNLSSKYDTSNMKKIRLFNKLTAEHILNCFIEKTGESMSDILSSLLTEKIFNATGQEMKKFQIIVSNLLKKRVQKDGGHRKEQFSPLILCIREQEGKDAAVEMMECLFQLNRDPFTAQQIARFYSDSKNYKKAEAYAKQATALLSSNSYVWDTYAQVYKDQLFDLCQSKKQTGDGNFSRTDLQDVIGLCQKCTELFRKEQTVSENEAFSGNVEINRAGYFGELKSILLLLSSIEKCSCLQPKVHEFLVNENYTDTRFNFLSRDETDYIKSLWKHCNETLRKLGDEFLQTKVEIEANLFSFHKENKRQLLCMHVSLNEYFGESSVPIPFYADENDECLYRYRLVFAKKCHSLYGALQLKYTRDFVVLEQCYNWMHKNVQSINSTVDDLKIILDILTVLVTENEPKLLPPNLQFEDVIHWSKDLYKRAMQEDYRHLEPFLYFTLYNFPTEERLQSPSLASAKDLETVMKNWKDVFNATKNLQRITYRETTLFFLGKGQPLKDIVFQSSLRKLMGEMESSEKWQSPEVRHSLKLLSGILSEQGDSIAYNYKNEQGNQNYLNIKTSNRHTKKIWRQKRIYFYLGFSFSGLKAYGLTDTNPTTIDLPVEPTHVLPRRTTFSGAQPLQNVKSLRELEELKRKITRQIEAKKRQRKPFRDYERQLDRINEDIKEIVGD